MENKQVCERFTYPALPAEDDRDSSKSTECAHAQVKPGKKKKQKKKRQNTEKMFPEKILTEQPTSQSSGNPKQDTYIQTTCDQSTQTDVLQNKSTQTMATQTFQLQCIHTQSMDSKSTQTHRTRPTLREVYEGQGSADHSSEGKEPNQLTLLTWNIDGLDVEDLKERIPSLLSYLGTHRADVVLLQELVPPYLKILQEIMTDYEFLQGDDSGYFTAILLRKSRVEFLQSNIVKFPTTEMGRNLLMANVCFSGQQLCFMTSHLESLKTSSQERMNQLRRVWKWMREAPDSHTVIFGGDTNLRDWEVKKLGGLPDCIMDVWEMLGQPEDCMYTWDTTTNNNKEVPFPVRLRFDRVYLRGPREGLWPHPTRMTLVGLEKLRCSRFTSDHWGILCTFSFESSVQ
ncbi:tyrosyl-DNA phosphodiesterase 2 isoform X2 [Electrophorus electricus]|uniref:Tyrosyl-DNA phosphodiesterase 2 n=1 Tax=Electrophorus electricus TaxID=8005 RepID=A0A4W4HIN9_ELEEL|nr:tyrosyl-DNA phosphodiesterase 2 isoform X2 [Electrophorus electricus]